MRPFRAISAVEMSFWLKSSVIGVQQKPEIPSPIGIDMGALGQMKMNPSGEID